MSLKPRPEAIAELRAMLVPEKSVSHFSWRRIFGHPKAPLTSELPQSLLRSMIHDREETILAFYLLRDGTHRPIRIRSWRFPLAVASQFLAGVILGHQPDKVMSSLRWLCEVDGNRLTELLHQTVQHSISQEFRRSTVGLWFLRNSPGLRDGLLEYYVAVSYVVEGRDASARRWLKRIVKRAPKGARLKTYCAALQLLARLDWSNGDESLAWERMNEAVTRCAKSVTVHLRRLSMASLARDEDRIAECCGSLSRHIPQWTGLHEVRSYVMIDRDLSYFKSTSYGAMFVTRVNGGHDKLDFDRWLNAAMLDRGQEWE